MNIVAKKKKLVRVKKMRKKERNKNQSKVLKDNVEVWEKSAPSHKVIQMEQIFEKK